MGFFNRWAGSGKPPNTPYTYAERPTQNMGVGVTNEAFIGPRKLPLLDWKGGGRNVKRDFQPLASAAHIYTPKVTDVSLRGNGVTLFTGVRLEPLLDFKELPKTRKQF